MSSYATLQTPNGTIVEADDDTVRATLHQLSVPTDRLPHGAVVCEYDDGDSRNPRVSDSSDADSRRCRYDMIVVDLGDRSVLVFQDRVEQTWLVDVAVALYAALDITAVPRRTGQRADAGLRDAVVRTLRGRALLPDRDFAAVCDDLRDVAACHAIDRRYQAEAQLCNVEVAPRTVGEPPVGEAYSVFAASPPAVCSSRYAKIEACVGSLIDSAAAIDRRSSAHAAHVLYNGVVGSCVVYEACWSGDAGVPYDPAVTVEVADFALVQAFPTMTADEHRQVVALFHKRTAASAADAADRAAAFGRLYGVPTSAAVQPADECAQRKAALARILKADFVVDDDVSHRMRASELLADLADLLSLPFCRPPSRRTATIDATTASVRRATPLSALQHKLAGYLIEAGLKKKRYKDGYYYYGIRRRVLGDAKADCVDGRITDFDAFVADRETPIPRQHSRRTQVGCT
jgi:hypothetical protein